MSEKVVPGQKVSIKASVWNTLMDMANSYTGKVGNSGSATPSRGKYVLVVNKGNTTIPRYSAVELTEPENSVDTADDPVMQITLPSGQDKPYAVLVDPAPKDRVVRAVVSGVVKANVTGNVGDYAAPGSDGAFASDEAGSARILTVGTPGMVMLGSAHGNAGGQLFQTWIENTENGCRVAVRPGVVFVCVGMSGGLVEYRPYEFIPSETNWKKAIDPGIHYVVVEFQYPGGQSEEDEGGDDDEEEPVQNVQVPTSWQFKVVTANELQPIYCESGPLRYPIATVEVRFENNVMTYSNVVQYHTGVIVLFLGGGSGGPSGLPEAAQYNVEMGDGTEGTDTANGYTWRAGQTDYGRELGLKEWYVSRVEYNNAGNQKLYAFMRQRVFSPDGRLCSVSGETRVLVDEPTSLILEM